MMTTPRPRLLLALTALLPALLSGGCRMDLLFAVWCTLALERLVRLADHPVDKRSHLILWLWVALAVLTKGPLVLAFLAGALVFTGRGSRAIVWRAVAGWGPLLAVGIVMPYSPRSLDISAWAMVCVVSPLWNHS